MNLRLEKSSDSLFAGFASMYMPQFPKTIAYMLQSTDYNIGEYFKWFWRTNNYNTVMYRRGLLFTRPIRFLLIFLRSGIRLQKAAGILIVGLGLFQGLPNGVFIGLAVYFATPVVWAHIIVLPMLFGKYVITRPAERRLIAASKMKFKSFKGINIAVVGSYGKTTMKDLLVTVLSEGLSVAATPANKNVAISHAYFARKLTGNEDVIIIEYGEGAPGDVAAFARNTHPTHAIITGVAPAHLDKYGTVNAAAADILSITDFVSGEHVYLNADSPYVADTKIPTTHQFSSSVAVDWKTSNIKTSLNGTTFTMSKDKQKIELSSQLIGKHQVGFLAFVAAFGLQLGLTKAQVKAGISKTKPYEHRMQPYQIGDAWIVDDTYNGNIEGIRAGTSLLSDLDATRKIYVTPGLVDQGHETEPVHAQMGKLIAKAKPDIVVLMQNSVTKYIQQGLLDSGYDGEVQIKSDPLAFYTNLNHFVAAGDVVIMQNDWTDNYK